MVFDTRHRLRLLWQWKVAEALSGKKGFWQFCQDCQWKFTFFLSQVHLLLLGSSTMMKSCSAVGCTNRSGRCKRRISFYRFPADPEKRAKWVAAVRRENWEPKKSSWICSAHFVSGKKSEDAFSPDYVPSVFSFVPSPVKRKQKILFESYERRSKRRCRSRLLPLSSEPATRTVPIPPAEGGLSATASNDRVPDVENGSDFIPPDDPASAVVDGAGEKSDVVNLQCHNTLLQEQVSKLQAENQFLRSNDVLSEESFINDDEKVKLYTGLPSYARLRATLDFVTAGLSGKQQGKLSQFSRFLLVLMKLRLNLLDADLARRFGVSPSPVSKIFTKWIHILYIRCNPWSDGLKEMNCCWLCREPFGSISSAAFA